MTTAHEASTFWLAVVVLTIFSAAGSFIIIFTVIKNHWKDFSSRLVFYLSIADFCLSVVCLSICAYNYSNGHLQSQNTFICQFQPVITWYFMEASILWLTMISINSFKVILFNSEFTTIHEIIANIICWGIPLLTSLLPVDQSSGENYNNRNGLWCSFAADQRGPQLANILIYYLPCLVIILSCYVAIGIKILRLGHNDITNASKREKRLVTQKLFLFVLAYFIVWTPLTISYIYEDATSSYIGFWTEFIVDNLLHVQGILNFILYGLTGKIKIDIYRKILVFLNLVRSSKSSGSDNSAKSKDNITDVDMEIV